MAIKISGSTVIDNSRNLTNVDSVTANTFFGDGTKLTGLGPAITVADAYDITGTGFDTNIDVSNFGIVSTNSLILLLQVRESGNTGYDTVFNTSAVTSTGANTAVAVSGLNTSTTYEFRAVAKSSTNPTVFANTGNKTFTTEVYEVSAPTILTPTNGSTTEGETPEVTTTALSVSPGNYGVTHLSTDWQVATDSGFSSIVVQNANSSSNLTAWTIPAGNLSTSTLYYVRARHKAANSGTGVSIGYGPYATISFTTFSAFGGEIVFNTSTTWSVPGYVGNSIDAVGIGGGGGGGQNYQSPGGGGGALAYKNNIAVTAGGTVSVQVGNGGQGNSGGGSSSFGANFTAGGGGRVSGGTRTGGDGGGNGGGGGQAGPGNGSGGCGGGGGGAGGYSGNGGRGGDDVQSGQPGLGGGGGGGGGGNQGPSGFAPGRSGGGVGKGGEGPSGSGGSQNGSGQAGSSGSGEQYGGGQGGSNGNERGGPGVVAILWGTSATNF